MWTVFDLPGRSIKTLFQQVQNDLFHQEISCNQNDQNVVRDYFSYAYCLTLLQKPYLAL